MYYAPWCGFCKSVKHVIMSLVDHYKHSEHIRIARLVDVHLMNLTTTAYCRILPRLDHHV